MKTNKLVTLLCATAMLVSLSACNNNSAEDSKPTSESTTASSEAEKNDVTSSEATQTENPTDDENTSAGGLDELATIVSKDVEDTVSELSKEYEQLKADVDTFDKYLANTDKVENFYTKVYETHNALCIRMCEYSLQYAETIVGSEKPNDEKYDELEELYDSIYDDAGDDIYDEIYDGILDDMYEDFYDGILDEAYDSVEYSVWSDARSNEYDWWSDTRSDVYDDWSDYRSDVYDFWSDVRGEIWDDDIEKANKKIEDFREDVEKLKGNATQQNNNSSDDEAASTTAADETEAPKDETPAENLVDGMRPEFKEALDSYEDFFDEYCAFMKKMKDNPDDLSLLGEYTEYLTQYSETMEKMGELDDGEMNDAELKYYLEVTNRINEKLLDAAL